MVRRNPLENKLAKPEWLKTSVKNISQIQETRKIVSELALHTVCDSAECPNIGECFGNKTATFMILGNTCTRQCRFCAVSKGKAEVVDPDEPRRIGEACKAMGLKHVVVTSVTRDDLSDGGAGHFAQTVFEIRRRSPGSTVELLIPDLLGNWEALQTIIEVKPDILNHNMETVPALYSVIRPEASYGRSLELLSRAKKQEPDIYTKSGIMVGLGETEEQVMGVMDDLRQKGCDILTIGQYLRPSEHHVEIKEYVHPQQFERYKNTAIEKGFRYVASGPFVRSSYHASLGIDALL
jgi:lipoic acid synthetase